MFKRPGIKNPLSVAIVALGVIAVALPAQARKNVVATIGQIGEPLTEIAAGKVNIITLMGEGVDPHLYRLTRSDVAKINTADLIVYNGLHLEAQMLDMLDRYSKRKPVIAVGDALTGKNLLPWDGRTHDPHIWLNPGLWALALQTAVDALAGSIRITPPCTAPTQSRISKN